MLLSMTGYSSKSIVLQTSLESINKKEISFAIEIKSLNSRFFELNAKLPNYLSFLETDLYLLLKKKLVRGRIYISVQCLNEDSMLEKINPSLSNINAYISSVSYIKKKCEIAGEFEIKDLIRMPDVFVSERNIISENTKKSFLKELSSVADDLNKQRALEGKSILKDVRLRFEVCKKSLQQIEKDHQSLMKNQKNIISKNSKLAEKGNELAKSKTEDLYATLNKMDVNEEITRFKIHLGNVNNIIKEKNIEAGKRLDFVLQELMREINTMAAKCSSAKISTLAVDIKVELEKVREQSQNVL